MLRWSAALPETLRSPMLSRVTGLLLGILDSLQSLP
jgi:hypothetical protein